MTALTPGRVALYEKEQMGPKLSAKMARRHLSVRAAAELIGISPATVCRIVNGGKPDVDSYLAVKLWLGRAALAAAKAGSE
jgi:plasmid maintenance system antidote protein VapI